MAERSNAHDSKSCYAGMYTRVQIPFSAPQKRICRLTYPFLLSHRKVSRNPWGAQGFTRGAENTHPYPFLTTRRATTLCCVATKYFSTRNNDTQMNFVVGAPLKAQIPFSAPTKKELLSTKSSFFCYPSRRLGMESTRPARCMEPRRSRAWHCAKRV